MATENGISTSKGFNKKVPFAENADYATSAGNATKINNLEIKRDTNGVLKIGDTIIPQKIKRWSGEEVLTSGDIRAFSIAEYSKNKTYEIVTSKGNFKGREYMPLYTGGSYNSEGAPTEIETVCAMDYQGTTLGITFNNSVYKTKTITIYAIYEVIE